MVTSKTEVSVKTVASASALVTDTTVGTGGGLFVRAARWDRFFSCYGAFDIPFASHCVFHPEEWLTARFACSFWHESQQLLFAGVVAIGEEDFDCRLQFVAEININ